MVKSIPDEIVKLKRKYNRDIHTILFRRRLLPLQCTVIYRRYTTSYLHIRYPQRCWNASVDREQHPSEAVLTKTYKQKYLSNGNLAFPCAKTNTSTTWRQLCATEPHRSTLYELCSCTRKEGTCTHSRSKTHRLQTPESYELALADICRTARDTISSTSPTGVSDDDYVESDWRIRMIFTIDRTSNASEMGMSYRNHPLFYKKTACRQNNCYLVLQSSSKRRNADWSTSAVTKYNGKMVQANLL